MDRPRTVVAIDGGNSKTSVAVLTDDGHVLAQASGGPTNQQVIGVDAVFHILRSLVCEAVEAAGAPVVDHVHACLAGADLEEEERLLDQRLRLERWGSTSSVVNDTFAVLRCGMPDDALSSGAVAVVCGAGLNAVGVSPDGRTARFLALGEMSGDWGGGGDLGQSAAWAAIRSEDGRGPDTVLRELVPRHFGLDRAVDVALGRYHGTIVYEDLYDLVPMVFTAARDGDAVCVDLLARLADEIVTMGWIAASRVGLTYLPAPVPLVLGGSLLAAREPVLHDRVLDRLRVRLPTADVVVTDTPPIAGAALLALDHVAASNAARRRVRDAFSSVNVG